MKKRNKIHLLVVVFLLISLFLNIVAINVSAIIPGEDASPTSETKQYCKATIEDDFADNRVLVVLTNAASLSF